MKWNYCNEDEHTIQHAITLHDLKLVNQFYGPEWVMRLYYQIPNKKSQNWSKLCHLVCNNHQLDICDIEHNPKFGKSYSRVHE